MRCHADAGQSGVFGTAADTGDDEGNMDGLDDFLNGPSEDVTEQPEAAAEVETTPEATAEPTGPVRDEKGRFAPKGETAEEAHGAPPAPEEANIPIGALKDERRKRQELEARLAEMEARLAQPAPQAQQPQQMQQQEQGPPDRWEDPEGYDRWLISQAAEQARAEALQAVQYQRIEQSALRARAKYSDYAEKHAVFGEMLQQNPALFQQMLQAEDPAEFAYNQAKTEIELRQYGGLDKLIEARVEAALKERQPAPTPSIPETLADSQSARGSSAAFVPPSLDDILGRRG